MPYDFCKQVNQELAAEGLVNFARDYAETDDRIILEFTQGIGPGLNEYLSRNYSVLFIGYHIATISKTAKTKTDATARNITTDAATPAERRRRRIVRGRNRAPIYSAKASRRPEYQGEN